MTAITIDIETIPDAEKAELFDLFVKIPLDLSREWWEKAMDDEKMWRVQYADWRTTQMSVTPEYCKIVGLNWQKDGEEPFSRWAGEVAYGERIGNFVPTDDITEGLLLRKAWDLMRIAAPIVTFNGSAFDLEVIRFRSMVLGIEPTCDLINLKPWENRHVDIMKRLYVSRKPIALKRLVALLGAKLEVPEKYSNIVGTEGSSIYLMYSEALLLGDFSLCKLYGELDVIYNMGIYNLGKGLWW